ncbi:MAG TPA: dienelactone hydrolase family protein [Methanomassiliicoccales archaeon]|jgi:carboxymethylenebutenolidase
MDQLESGGWNYTIFQGRLPLGIILIHEIKGIDEYALSVGKKLSNEGYWTILPDLFRGKTASTLEEGRKIRDALTKEQVLEAMSGGRELLKKRIGDRRIGTMGFCMGGGFALLGACNMEIDFCVDYYGMLEDAKDLVGLVGPVQLMLGSEDKHVTPWALANMLPAMVEHRKRLDVHLYPNAGHAFHRPDWPGHEPIAAKDAWRKTLLFIRERLE